MAVKTIDLVKVIPVDTDGEGKGMEVFATVAELNSSAVASVPEATTTVEGTVKQMTATADQSPDFATLAAVTVAYNALLAKLRTSGQMAP